MTSQPVVTSESDELALLREATLGDYDVAGEAGRGGMATVYLAHDIALDRKVAVKVMSPAIATTAEMVERFKREARTAASLSHPNIIPIYAVRHTDSLLYFVMKLIEGRPLDCILRDMGPLPIPMVQAIVGQVAEALGYAHRRGVVHRDVKPANILIDDEGWCVVTDFGIAKVRETENLTTSGTMVGTPIYMSPEQCLARDVTGAADQYALGVVAYEMLTGKVPFAAGAMMATMYAHVHTPPAPIESLRPDCPEPLRAAVMRMLAKDPQERWPSVEDAAAAIGATALPYDDPTRSQMITLARSGSRPSGQRGRRTPRSPVPRARTPMPNLGPGGLAAAANRLSPATYLAAAGGVALLLAAAVWFAPWRREATRSADAPAPSIATSSAIETGAVTPAPAPAAVPAPKPASPVPSVRAVAIPSVRAVAIPTAPTAGRPNRPAPDTTAAAAPRVAVAVASVESDYVEPEAPAPAASGSPLLNAAGAAGGVAPDVRAAIERTIRLYAQALAAGEADEAYRLNPGMTDERHARLSRAFAQGQRIAARWRVSDVAVKGRQATARVHGTLTTLAPDRAGAPETIDQRVQLERAGTGWRLRDIEP